ncbi:hypothetical protein LTR84_010773 [Exophiala bonariae]|uniref:BZIP domain-containing protein n=1 Tax=Exophiala bonariae TaxID=1690606 RepID=A0AAV9MS95_9EURO|nr:hypothetical protein LTR84_010773 [Exophiala bonariae]
MDYFSGAAIDQSPYFGSIIDPSRSNFTSPGEAIRNLVHFDGIDRSRVPVGQTWDPMSLDIFKPFTGKRRMQNRASQRAFRDRKERHVKGLEEQLELLHEKHQDLRCSYNCQTKGFEKLDLKISKLGEDFRMLSAKVGGGIVGDELGISSKEREQTLPGWRRTGKRLEAVPAIRLQEKATGSRPQGSQKVVPSNIVRKTTSVSELSTTFALQDEVDAFFPVTTVGLPCSSEQSAWISPLDDIDQGLHDTVFDTLDWTTGSAALRSEILPELEDWLNL